MLEGRDQAINGFEEILGMFLHMGHHLISSDVCTMLVSVGAICRKIHDLRALLYLIQVIDEEVRDSVNQDIHFSCRIPRVDSFSRFSSSLD